MSIRALIKTAALLLAVAASPAHAGGQTYWSLFNIEGESAQTAQYVTYASLSDMLIDSNRLGTFSPNPSGFGVNIVGSGSNGDTYWSLFNIEGESAKTAQYVTYASLSDMLIDSNRLGTFSPNPSGFGVNIVGSGSDVRAAGGGGGSGNGSQVPEPTTLLLVGPALTAMVLLRRRRPA